MDLEQALAQIQNLESRLKDLLAEIKLHEDLKKSTELTVQRLRVEMSTLKDKIENKQGQVDALMDVIEKFIDKN